MDAKDLRTQSALSERSDDVSKYTQSGTAIQSNRNKSYQHVGSNSSIKMDTMPARPCAVIGPDRVLPHAAASDAYLKKTPLDPWACTDTTYRAPPEYPNKTINYQNLIRNESPRQIYQENMQRVMVPPTYNGKTNDDTNFPQIPDRNVPLSKGIKPNNPNDGKYCDVPYAGHLTSNDSKVRPEMCVTNVNPILTRSAPHGWPPASVNIRPQRTPGAAELYQFPEYPSCAGPRPVSISRSHRTIQEEPGYMYADSYYQEPNIRFKPYPSVKERYPPTRYNYVSNYSNPFHPPPFSPHRYDLSKPLPPHSYSGYPHLKYVDSRMPESVMDGYQRPLNQQISYNAPFRNQIVHPTYGPALSNCSQSKIPPYPPDGSVKPVTSNKLPYDNNGKMYVDYEGSRIKTYHSSENFYANEPSRIHPIKSQAFPNYPPTNMQAISPHLLYKKGPQFKNYEYLNHYKNSDPLTHINSPLARYLPQFSPSAIAISPTDSNTSNDTAQTQGTSEDYGYVSQSSVASVRSIDSGMSRVSNDYSYGRYYDYRYGQLIRTPFSLKTGLNPNRNTDSKDKKNIDVRQFLQMWNEGDDENGENNSNKEIVIQNKSNDTNKFSKQQDLKNQEQLYVLGLVNVPSEELSKYEHIQKVSKLPENIKGYNNIELLNQFEEVIESSNMNCSISSSPNEFHNPLKGSVLKQTMVIPPRPMSPLDVESKISQSVIHKQVGCNFEIKPCSPKMLNVEMATSVQNVLGERSIEKVTNPLANAIESSILNRVDENIETCTILNRQDQRLINENNKISSCEMVNTQYSNNNHINTDYSIQDLESNSGVCLASLPRLDNDIELNFPEVNQQFINANKGDSLSIIKDLPTLEMTDQTSSNIIPKDLFKFERQINNQMSPSIESEKEFTKLSKYRKMKMGDEIKDENIQHKVTRTDSVIIKNPENTKSYDDSKEHNSIHKLLAESQQTPINLTSQSDMKIAREFITDMTMIGKPNMASHISNDIAIDFSLDRSDNDQTSSNNSSSETNLSKELSPGNMLNVGDLLKNIAQETKNDNENKFVNLNIIESNGMNATQNDIVFATDTKFAEDHQPLFKEKNTISKFSTSKTMPTISETTLPDAPDTDIKVENVSSTDLGENADASMDSINHEKQIVLTEKVNTEIYTSECNFNNTPNQDNRQMGVGNNDNGVSVNFLPSTDDNISSSTEIERNKNAVDDEICKTHNEKISKIEKMNTEMYTSECNFNNTPTQDNSQMDVGNNENVVSLNFLPSTDDNISSSIEIESYKNAVDGEICKTHNEEISKVTDDKEEITKNIENKKSTDVEKNMNQTEVCRENIIGEVRAMQSTSNDNLETSESKNSLESDIVYRATFQDTKNSISKQPSLTEENIVNCNELLDGHIVPTADIQNIGNPSSAKLRDGTTKEASEQFSSCVEKNDNFTFQKSLQQMEISINEQILPNCYESKKNSLNKLLKKCSGYYSKALYSRQIQNLILFNEGMCGPSHLNKKDESGVIIDKVSVTVTNQFETDSCVDNDKHLKECRKNKVSVEELQPNVSDTDRSFFCHTIKNNTNVHAKQTTLIDSAIKPKFIVCDENSLNISTDDSDTVNMQQKIPYINEFYDEIESSNESISVTNKPTSPKCEQTIKNQCNKYLETGEKNIALIKTNINDLNYSDIAQNDLSGKRTQDMFEESDDKRSDGDSTSKCDEEKSKFSQCRNSLLFSKRRISLKRSFSDSALNIIQDDIKQDQEGIDNIPLVWPPKRKKHNIINSVESNLLAQNLCSILQSNRRNSISSIYNEENVSFCILIDNNCIITEGNEEEEKICYTELSEDCLSEIHNDFRNEEGNDVTDATEELELCPEVEDCGYSDSFMLECDQEKSMEASWVEDVACVETVFSDNIAEDVIISALSSPKDTNLSDNDESSIFGGNISEHTNKVKYIYGEKMCNDDAQFVETLYNTPQMNVNKTLTTRESQVSEDCNKFYDKESLEKVLSESNSRGASPCRLDYTESIFSTVALSCDKTPDNKENMNMGNISPLDSKAYYANTVNVVGSDKAKQEISTLKIKEISRDDKVHSCESSIDNVFAYKQNDDGIVYTSSCSPEVSSTTSEEKNASILLKITNYKGSIISQINEIKSDDNNHPSCKYTEKKDYINSNSKIPSNRPLITKAAQKYIPPLKESIRDLKVKLSLPQHSLIKLKQMKISKDEPKNNKLYTISSKLPKKPKPKFEDVLMSIDEIQFKMHKEKNKKPKKLIPKVVIKKNENGSHYASTSNKDIFNPDLTGRKWQPWVFLEKDVFIDKMAVKGKAKAVYSHRKNTYVLAEKFHKYKSVNSTKFVISQPKSSNSSTGQLKYTIRLKHNY